MESQIQVITYAKEAFGIKFACMNKKKTLAQYKEEVFKKKEYDVYDVLIRQDIKQFTVR